METYTSLGELYEHGKVLATSIDDILGTNDGERVVRHILVNFGIDPRTQDNLSVPIPTKTLFDLSFEINKVKDTLQNNAINNRNIMQAIAYALSIGKTKEEINQCLNGLGFENEQFKDKKGWLGLRSARKIIDALTFLTKDHMFGINMGRYASETNVLNEAKTLAIFSKDIATFLYLSSGLTRNYFNNCWGTTTLPIISAQIDGAPGIEQFTADVIWSDILGVRPNYHEWGYTFGLFEKAIFKVLKYFERAPRIFSEMQKRSSHSKELQQLLREISVETLSSVKPVTAAINIDGLLLAEGDAIYRYSTDKNTVLRTQVDEAWNPIESTKISIGETDNEGKFALNDIVYNAETSSFGLRWYERRAVTHYGRFFEAVRKLIQNTISTYVENRYRKQRFNEIISEGATFEREKDRIEIARLNGLVHQREKELQQALEVANKNERLAAIGLLGTSFAHEINNPLAAAGTHLRIVKALISKDPNKAITFLDSAIGSIDQAKAVVTIFRSSTRISDNKESYNLNDLCDTTLKINPYTEQGYEIATFYQYDLHPIYCNKTDIIQLLTNHFNNAFEAMSDKEEKKLTITTTTNKEYVILTIQDTGGGIREDYIQKIFTPFFTTKRQESVGTGGTGLGLYRCKKIIEEMHGRIEFRNYQYSSGNGAEFKIYIPLGVK